MRLHGLDLNLLIALEALLATRSVTLAARRLHVTQPSMSGSLSRLREHFQDPLLVPAGRRLEPSALGEVLATMVVHTLEQVKATADLRATFDPATSRHRFRLAASEPTVLSLLGPVLRLVEQRAPGVTVELLPSNAGLALDRLQRRELDFVFYPERYLIPGHPHRLAIDDTFSCIVWSGNEAVGRRLTLDLYLALPHIVGRYGDERRPSFEQWSLERLAVQRREAISCHSPVLMGALVVGTQRIATIPTALARAEAAHRPLRVLKPPLALPNLRIFMQWHRARDNDSAMRWFQDQVMEASSADPSA